MYRIKTKNRFGTPKEVKKKYSKTINYIIINIDILNRLYFQKHNRSIPDFDQAINMTSKKVENIKDFISILKFRLPIFEGKFEADSILMSSELEEILEKYRLMIKDLEHANETNIISYLIQTEKGTLQLYTDQENKRLIADFYSYRL